ncbi:mannosyltransferase putative-domain-containing protein [Gorgonomyces haynaldii]|nr:mannosyltransferase putative-domain-containing protein [Gorgonomyces haynaldii]
MTQKVFGFNSVEEPPRIYMTDVVLNVQRLRDYKKDWENIIYRDYDRNYFENSTGAPKDVLDSLKRISLLERSKLLDWNVDGRSMYQLYSSYRGRGIVMPVGNHDFILAMASISAIRNVHKSNISIQVFFNGEEDLMEECRESLKQFENVHVQNIHDIFPRDKVGWKGWSVKAATLLAAHCRECILMDSDVIFMQNPEIAFEQSKYIKSRMLLFKDRTMDFKSTIHMWVKEDLIPKERIAHVDEMRMFRGEHGITYHEAESGVVVIDKSQRFIGLIGITYLNIFPVNIISYKGFHGDKETFWIGMEMLSENYSFDSHLPVGIGGLEPEITGPDRFCSCQIAHQDENGDLFWVNGGVVTDKTQVRTSPFVNFTHYVLENGPYSSIEHRRNSMCLNTTESPLLNLTAGQVGFFSKLRNEWQIILNVTAHIDLPPYPQDEEE